MLLISLLFSTVFTVSIVSAEVPPVKQVITMQCCNGETLVGYSNNCTEGEGGCKDNSCPSGYTEELFCKEPI